MTDDSGKKKPNRKSLRGGRARCRRETVALVCDPKLPPGFSFLFTSA